MTMRTHELHPSMVHLPLVFLPMTASVDLAAAMRPLDRRLDRFGARLWWTTAGVALAAGLAGMAASQEVELPEERARDMMFLHGIGNFALVVAAFGMAAYRSRRRSSLTAAITGLVASGASIYTAYLGGELVYSYGAGVKALGGRAAEMPALFSGQGLSRLAADAGRGLSWLMRRAYRAASGEERIDRGALGAVAEIGGGAAPITQH